MRKEATITYNNVILTLGEWSKRLGISKDAVRKRYKLGIPLEVKIVKRIKNRCTNNESFVIPDLKWHRKCSICGITLSRSRYFNCEQCVELPVEDEVWEQF